MNTSKESLFVPPRTLVLVGMMGAGKTSIGRRLAAQLGLPFVDSDDEIATASGMSISRYFEQYGEVEFRKGERKVIARLLERPRHVLSTGGGAYMAPETRKLIRAKAFSIYLKADPSILVERATRHNDRPLLQKGNPHEIMAHMLAEREPIYAEADITVESNNRPIDETVNHVLNSLYDFVYSDQKNPD